VRDSNVNVPSKSNIKKIRKKLLFFVGILEVTDEKRAGSGEESGSTTAESWSVWVRHP
jgi:hypothetical protein